MLSQQKSKQVFKTLDGSIQTVKPTTGESIVISQKCAEIDKMVPWIMNVSRAILENVIFVHQEDSSWPLTESKPLKEKFDAIFAATKYTDALVRMRAIIKEKNQVWHVIRLMQYTIFASILVRAVHGLQGVSERAWLVSSMSRDGVDTREL